MSSKRDLVEAHSFNRRRLVTAFLSGAPGGREVEPVRYGRTLVGGAVLAGMILAGAAVLGFISPTVSNNWDDHGVVVDKDNGSRFIAKSGWLFPVVNTASARLLTGAGKINLVPDKLIAQRPHGPAYGIPNAPDVLPAHSMLANTGWTACTNSQGMVNLSIQKHPGATPAAGRAVPVKVGQSEYLIAGTRRYKLPSNPQTARTVLQDIGVNQSPISVRGQWLNLFAPGQPMALLPVPKQTEVRFSGGQLKPAGYPVDLSGSHYVLVGNKGQAELRPLSPFAYQLYKAEAAAKSLSPLPALPSVPPYGKPYAPPDWPKQTVKNFGRNPCALLHTKARSAPTVTLATPRTSVVAAPTGPAADNAASPILIRVQPGVGAVVRSFDGVPDKGLEYLIDSQGRRYALNQDGSSPDVLTRLGYGDLTPPSVPNTWLALFTGDAQGPALSYKQADKTVM